MLLVHKKCSNPHLHVQFRKIRAYMKCEIQQILYYKMENKWQAYKAPYECTAHNRATRS